MFLVDKDVRNITSHILAHQSSSNIMIGAVSFGSVLSITV